MAYRSFVLNQHGIQVNLALRGVFDAGILPFFPYDNQCFLLFALKTFPHYLEPTQKPICEVPRLHFVLFLCFSLIICLTGMCGLIQRHRTKERMTILFAVIDIKKLLWAFLAEHLHCCFHLFVDLYIHRRWDTGGRVCDNRRIKSKCYCSCR